jgi:hypothetical protein
MQLFMSHPLENDTVSRTSEFHAAPLPVKLSRNSEFHAAPLPVKLSMNSEFHAAPLPVKLSRNSEFHAVPLPVKLSRNSEFDTEARQIDWTGRGGPNLRQPSHPRTAGGCEC